MKTLKDFIKESVVNETSVPAVLRKLPKNIEVNRVEGSDGSGYLIGEWLDPFGGKYSDDHFDIYIKGCMKAFKAVEIGGRIIDEPIQLKEALSILESNGEDPEGALGFVLMDDFENPMLYSNLFFN